MNARPLRPWPALSLFVLACFLKPDGRAERSDTPQLLGAALPAASIGLDRIFPPPESVVRELRTIEVEFSEPVAGVDAADLLVNGVGATDVQEFAPGQFIFSFLQPPNGTVTVSWRTGHGIVSRENPDQIVFAAPSWAYLLDPSSPAPDVMITEFMADNRKGLHDEDGDNSDWIEIFNGHDTAVSLNGWFLTDDASNLAKWRFPDLAIGPGQFLVLFASEKNRTNAIGQLHTNFKLAAEGEYLALVSAKTNVVSEFGPTYPPQRPDVSYGRVPGAPETTGYFVQPTPGARNSDSGAGFGSDVIFSRLSSTFTEPFKLVLSASSNAVIRYTLDGNLPTNTSPTYLAPIPITDSVQVRARVFQDGLLPGRPRSESFIMLGSTVTGFASDLPVLIIHDLGKGAPSAGRQNFAHLSVYEPVDGLTSLTNPPTLATRTGIKVRGSSTEGYPKVSLAVEFWDEFNQDQKHEFLGLPSESDWVLYAPNNFEPVLIHNPFIHQLSRDIGRYSSRTRFVEVYLNKGTGPITSAHYNGIYVLEEKIKIGPNRVAIDPLQPEDVKLPEVTGGYLLKIDRLDPGDTGVGAGGQAMAYVDPKERDIKLPQRDPQEQYIKGYFNDFARALTSSTWLDPAKGYAAYIDTDAWIDFHVIEVLSGNVDAIVLSTYFHKPRLGKIVFGPHWDFDRALGSTDGRDANPRNWQTGPFFTGWWGRLFRDPDFWQKWIDRYEELRGSTLSLAHIDDLIDRQTDEVRQAQPRERQRWHVAPRGGSYQGEINLMKNWLSNRVVFIDRQLVQPPSFSAVGGRVTPGFTLSLAAPTNALVYFTLDGTDPRLSQGGLSPAAQLYSNPIVVQDNVRVVARARNLAQRQTGGPPISSPWSMPVAATFAVAPPPLLLTELMFHPEPPESGSTNSAADFQFLELKNASDRVVNLAGYQLRGSVQFQFTGSNLVSQLEPGERVLLVRNTEAFRQRWPLAAPIGGEFSGDLNSGNPRLTLTGPLDEPIFDFTYDSGWYRLADGLGFSLVPVQESVSGIGPAEPSFWRLSAQPGGSPGQGDPDAPRILPVMVNELLPNPLPNTRDALELFNPAAEPADISGWFLSDDFLKPKKFRLPASTIVSPNGYLQLDSSAWATSQLGFSQFGEQIYLFSANPDGTLSGWFHGFNFGAAEEGVSFGRYLTSTGAEAFVAQRTSTLGSTNSGPLIGPVVIHAIMLGTQVDGSPLKSGEQFVELWNTSDQPVSLFDLAHPTNAWRLRGPADFDFPVQSVIEPHSFAIVVGFDPQSNGSALGRFQSRYGLDRTDQLFGPWKGGLDPTAGIVRLLKPGEPRLASGSVDQPEILVEQVGYSTVPPWPVLPNGFALLRRDSFAFADDPANWGAALPTPGQLDTDSDGLPDQWERRHGLDPADPQAANGALGDPDGDGFTNLQEFLSGTDPQSASSALQLTPRLISPGVVALEFRGVPGRSYSLQYRDGLTQGHWELLQGFVPASGDPVTFSDLPGKTNRFYRLKSP